MNNKTPSLKGKIVVTAEQMAEIEQLSIADGASAEAYMLAAGKGIASFVSRRVDRFGCEKSVTLLIGKGNNGGDAFVVGKCLLEQGYSVLACPIFPMDSLSPLSQKHCQAFIASGGALSWIQSIDRLTFPNNGMIVDGLLGTGFQGALEGLILEVVQKANGSGLPIIAIDIPSGVNGNSGQAPSGAIMATETVALGAPKLGFFIGQGYKYIGQLSHVDFGLEAQYYNRVIPPAYLITETEVKPLLPPLIRTQHKYQAGYVLAIAGSPGMPGAGILAAKGAFRSGAGIVRLFHPVGMESELAHSPDELLRTPFSYRDPSPVWKEEERAGCCLIGPGIGRSDKMGRFVNEFVKKSRIPLVIDADGLWHLKGILEQIALPCVLTPHRQEMARLLGVKKLDEATFLELCQDFVDCIGHTLVLKGAPTFIFSPHSVPLIVPMGDRGMATAGTGDVLTGVIATFLAKQLLPQEAAALGVYLHGLSGVIAAKQTTSYGLIASDVVDSLPEALMTLL